MGGRGDGVRNAKGAIFFPKQRRLCGTPPTCKRPQPRALTAPLAFVPTVPGQRSSVLTTPSRSASERERLAEGLRDLEGDRVGVTLTAGARVRAGEAAAARPWGLVCLPWPRPSEPSPAVDTSSTLQAWWRAVGKGVSGAGRQVNRWVTVKAHATKMPHAFQVLSTDEHASHCLPPTSHPNRHTPPCCTC